MTTNNSTVIRTLDRHCNDPQCRILSVIMFTVACLTVMAPARADLVGYWNFDDNVEDHSGTGNDGELNGAVYVDDVAFGDGKSLSFSADDQHVLIPADPSLDSDVFTLAMFINSRGQTGAFERFTSRQSDKFETAINVHPPSGGTGQLSYYSPAAGWNWGNTEPEDNVWHHVAYVSTGSEVSIYFDGDLVFEPKAWSVTELPGTFMHIGNRHNNVEGFDGLMDEVALWDEVLAADEISALAAGKPVIGPPPTFNGGGESYAEDFGVMALGKRLPPGWRAEDAQGSTRNADGFGLNDGPLGVGDDADAGTFNLGGNAERFQSTDPGTYLPTWKDNLDQDLALTDGDVIADAAEDRALGILRLTEEDPGQLIYEVEIGNKPLRAFKVGWDLEVWGGDPEAEFRGGDGAGFRADLSVNGTSYYSHVESLLPGDRLDTVLDGSNVNSDTTLIDGNIHSSRNMGSDLVEVAGDDGTVGNTLRFSFDANFGGDDTGWIPAIDNVLLRAVAPGDVDANGSVGPLDIVELLKGGQFDQGAGGVTWQQGDFNGDDKFDPLDLVEVLTFLSGKFPNSYAMEPGDPSDDIPDVIIDFTTGEITIDFAGQVASSIIFDSEAGIFNGDAPAWDTMGEFRTASANQISNTMFGGTESGVDNLGNLLKAEFMNGTFDFAADLTVNVLIATPDGPVTVEANLLVPEPSTWVLLGLGSLALIAIVRRRMA